MITKCLMCEAIFYKKQKFVCYRCGKPIVQKNHPIFYANTVAIWDLAYYELPSTYYHLFHRLSFTHKSAESIKSLKYISVYVKEIVDVLYYSFTRLNCKHIFLE